MPATPATKTTVAMFAASAGLDLPGLTTQTCRRHGGGRRNRPRGKVELPMDSVAVLVAIKRGGNSKLPQI